MRCLVIHYSEIGIKGKNREFFERKLKENIKKVLGKEIKKLYRRYGRLVGELKKNFSQENIKKSLERIPGIAYFSFAYSCSLDLEKIKQIALEILKEKKEKTFKIETKRSNKQFPWKSPEINRWVGSYLEKETQKRVDYKNPEKVLFLEIGEKEAFLYDNKQKGVGGLPTGTGGKLICSFSGGIDSPVASFLMMKRGCQIVFVHFYNQILVGSMWGKIEGIIKQLTHVQLRSKLYLVPFGEIQKEIIREIPAKLRMLVYRRLMMKIIDKIAQQEKAKGVITGDSLGQVASQTLENLACIYKATELPVFAPLLGLNKEEIVNLAKKIGTYAYSIQPYPDCCSFLIARHPETKGEIKELEQREVRINQKELVENSLKKAKVIFLEEGRFE